MHHADDGGNPGQQAMSLFDERKAECSSLFAVCKEQINDTQRCIDQLNTSQDSHELRSVISSQMGKLKEGLEKQKSLLISMESKELSPSEQNEIVRQSSNLQNQLYRFQDMQKRVKEVLGMFVSRVHDIVERENESSPLMHSEHIQQQLVNSEVAFNEQLLMEREQGIKEIASAMFDVQQLLRDLGLIVREQQYGIDNIEANLEVTSSRHRNAVRELDRANEYRRGRAWTVYSFFLVILVLLIILLFLISI